MGKFYGHLGKGQNTTSTLTKKKKKLRLQDWATTLMVCLDTVYFVENWKLIAKNIIAK